MVQLIRHVFLNVKIGNYITLSLQKRKLNNIFAVQIYEENMNNEVELPENQSKTLQLYRLKKANREKVMDFCCFLASYGSSFYTMRDKLVYNLRPFDRWEWKGIGGMIREFAPDYQGRVEDFFGTLESKGSFVRFMAERGGMGRTSCYSRFQQFNFRPWEIIGLKPLYRIFKDSYSPHPSI